MNDETVDLIAQVLHEQERKRFLNREFGAMFGFPSWKYATDEQREQRQDDARALIAAGLLSGGSASEVVCLCGSMRFFDDMLTVARDETNAGRIVLMPYSVITLENQGSDLKAMLDRLHREKIDLSRGIVVVSRGGYIGESTRGEIEYAEKTGKPVRYVDFPEYPEVSGGGVPYPSVEDPIECDGGPYCSAQRHYAFCAKDSEQRGEGQL